MSYKQRKEINVFCSYIPCGYTGKLYMEHDYLSKPVAVGKCPSCGYFTLHDDDENWAKEIADEFIAQHGE